MLQETTSDEQIAGMGEISRSCFNLNTLEYCIIEEVEGLHNHLEIIILKHFSFILQENRPKQ